MDLPAVMRAAQASDYGDIDKVVTVEDGVPRPVPAMAKGRMLVRVHACALAPGDVRVLSGLTREVQGPPHMPYVPGGDVAGVVEAPGGGDFQVGDRVVAMFTGPRSGLAQFALAQHRVAAKVPDHVSLAEAAGLGSSGLAAYDVAKRVRKGERILVIGGTGGVGHYFVQLAKLNGAAFVAGTAAHPERLAALGVDRAIDYAAEDVWSMPEFEADPFDTVVDFAGGAWARAERSAIVKSGRHGGRFLTTTPDSPTYEVHGIWQGLQTFLFPAVSRHLATRIDRSRPRYSFVMGLNGAAKDNLRAMVALLAEGKLRSIVDPAGPFPFTTDGVRAALRLQESRHAYGKVVVAVDPRAADAAADPAVAGSAAPRDAP